MQGPNRFQGKGRAKPAGGRPNTIGLGQRELGELLDQLDSPESETKNPKRNFVRWPFRETSVRVQILHAGGMSSWITVACRNLSRAGMSILHSSFAHTGTKCRVLLPHPSKGEVTVSGTITRCGHRTGVVHEIGIRFDQHLNVQEFLQASPLSDWFSLERVNPEELTGTIAYVDDSEIDRKIIRHFLRGTKLNVVVAASAAESLTCIDESVNLVLLDLHLGDSSGVDLAMKLRENGLEMPIILLTCDTAMARRDVLDRTRANAFLAKPVSQELLLRAIGEFLIVQRGSAGKSKQSVERANPALTQGLLQALGQYAKRLEDFAQGTDAAGARTLCLQIAGTAGTAGLQDVSQLATKAAEGLSRSMDVKESLPTIRALIAVCRRASERAIPAAGTRSAA
ncbi:MAG: response regulator [Phycisphaeraceae bacterium]|nr:response regulator [Phycisphaeraceae bacterium]